jgi:tetratricopeptide (TPR) repeat protein
MGKSSPKPPPAPDYAAAAQAQGQANLDAARLTARISNPNISTPYGGQKVTFGKSVFDEAGYNKAMEDYNKQLEAFNQQQIEGAGAIDRDGDMYGLYGGGVSRVGGVAKPVAPTREQFTQMTDQDTPYIEQYLSPEQQKILEAQQRVELGLSGLGETALGTAQDIIGKRFNPNLRDLQTDLTGYGQVQGAPDLMGMGSASGDVQAFGYTPAPDLERYGLARGGPRGGMFGLASGDVAPLQQQTALDTSGVANVQYAPNLSAFGFARGEVPTEQLQRGIDTSQLAAMPVSAGTTGQQAILSRVMPQIQEQRQMLETQLANQGIPRGSEAYNRAIREQQQQENDAIQQAALQGLQLDMAARQQGFSEAQAAAQFANQAALGQFGMGTTAADVYNRALQQNVGTALSQQQAQNMAQQQDFAQRVAAGEFGNAAQQALFGAGVQGAQLQNQAIAQNFGQFQSAQQMQNQAIAQNQDAALRAYQALLAGQGQAFGQQMDTQAARNAALAQNQNVAAQQQQMANAAQLQQYNQALQNAQFGNTALQQSLQQQLALRNQPLNEIAALMSGVQVNMPQFQGYQGANVAAAPVFAGTQAAGDFAQRNYANQTAAYNAKMGLLSGLAGAAGTAAGGGFFGNPFGGP